MTETTLTKGMMLCDVLSIDAWADGDGGWQWNAWYKYGDPVEVPRGGDKVAILALGVVLGMYDVSAIPQLEVDDSDERNIVIQNRNTGEPLFAFDYGAHWEVNGL